MSVLLTLLLTLLAGDTAAATGGTAVDPDPAATLTFQFLGCPDGLAREVEDLVRADVSWAPGDPPAALTVQCEAARVTLLLPGDDGGVAERKLDLATTPPEARARTAALIATELILVGRRSPLPTLPARRVTAMTVPEEPTVTATPGDEEPPRRSPPPRSPPVGRRQWALLAVFGASSQAVAEDVPMFDAGARGRFPVAWTFDLTADAMALYQRRTSTYGTSQGLGGALSLVAETRLRFRGGAAHAGLGVRTVGLHVAGEQPAGTAISHASAWGSSIGPMARLAISGEGAHLLGELALEGGWCGPDVVGMAAGGSPIGVGGWWAGVSLGAGWLADVD